MDDELKKFSLEELGELYFSLGEHEEIPVDIVTFLESKKFLGGYFEDGLYSYWKEVLQKIYPSPFYSPYWLVSFRGAIGLGKSTIAAAGILYDLHRLLCLISPQSSFNLVESEKILFMLFNVTKGLAETVMWDKITQMMQLSPYFSNFYDIYHKKPKDETMFPKRIDFGLGSRIPDSLGKAVVGGAIDEVNFGILNEQMYNNFNSLIRRMQSRFMSEGAKMPARLWVISSESEDQSVMNQIVDQYKNDGGCLIVQESLWAVKSHLYSDFPEESFWVYKGSDARAPEIIDTSDRAFKTDPDNCVQVPQRHFQTFDADIHRALRDLAGYSTGSSYKLFKARDRLNAALKISPIFDDSFVLSFSNKEDQIQTHCHMPQYFSSRNVNKYIPRYIHIDVGLTGDRFGMACSYVKGFSIEKSYDDIHMIESEEEVPNVVTEWAFGIEPEPGEEVPLYKAEKFVKWLAEQGFVISGVSADGYQSKQLLQNLRLLGFNTVEFSVDKTVEPYLELRNSVYRKISTLPNNKILKKEAENLIVTKQGKTKKWKIDHPEKNPDSTKGSKDIMDAVCGSQAQARENAFNDRARYTNGHHDSNSEEMHNLKKHFWPDK
jgi:hypothetical protein